MSFSAHVTGSACTQLSKGLQLIRDKAIELGIFSLMQFTASVIETVKTLQEPFEPQNSD